MVKTPPVNAGDVRDAGSIPGLERSPGGGHGNPLQYSCLENPMDRGAWQATVHWDHKEADMIEQLSHTYRYMHTHTYIHTHTHIHMHIYTNIIESLQLI